MPVSSARKPSLSITASRPTCLTTQLCSHDQKFSQRSVEEDSLAARGHVRRTDERARFARHRRAPAPKHNQIGETELVHPRLAG